MKILKYIVIIICILILLAICGICFLFSSTGNNIIKSYVQDLVKEKVGYDVKFDKFNIGFSTIDIDGLLNDEIKTTVNGKYSLLARNFDLAYDVNIKNLNTFKLKLKEQMNLKGQIRGKFSDFGVNGTGNMFDSNLNFLAKIKDLKPVDADVNAKNLDIAKILDFLNQPIYVNGKIDVVAKVKDENGEANITSKNAVLSQKTFKELGVALPNNTALNLNSNIKVKDMVAYATSYLTSDLATLNADNTVYDVNKKDLKSDFHVNVADMSKLSPIIQKSIKGKLKADGNLELKDNQISFVDANITGFGGEILAHLKDSKLKANLNNLELSDLVQVADLKPLVFGKLNGIITIDDVFNTNKIVGTSDLSIQNGGLRQDLIKKLFNVSIPKNTTFTAKNKTNINNGDVQSTLDLNSNILTLKDTKLSYNLTTKDGKANFLINFPDISKLSSLTNAKLQGSANIKGDATISKNQLSLLNALVSTLSGTINITTNTKNLDATIQNIGISELLSMVGQPIYATGKINGNVKLSDIDPKHMQGTANIKINDGVLNKPVIDGILQKNFPKDVKFSLDANTRISNSIAKFTSGINSDLINLSKFDGSYNINAGMLDSQFVANIKDLGKLEFITGKKLAGAIVANGTINFNPNNLIIVANSDFLGGKLKFNLNDSIANITLTDFKVKDLTDLLILDHFYDGVGKADLNYNTKNASGKFNVLINEGRLTSNKLTDLIKLTTAKDLTTEVYKDATITGTINQNIVKFDANMISPKSKLNVAQGTMNIATKAINIPVAMNIEKTDLAIDIKGTTENPKMSVSSKYLEDKLDKLVGKGLNKLIGNKDSKKDDTNQSKAKDDSAKDIVDDQVDKLIEKGFNKLFGK